LHSLFNIARIKNTQPLERIDEKMLVGFTYPNKKLDIPASIENTANHKKPTPQNHVKLNPGTDTAEPK